MSNLLLTAMARLRVKPISGSGLWDGPAELPRVTPVYVYSPPTGGTLHTPADAAALATILANPNTTLQLGDIIQLTAGVQYTGAGQTQQTFPAVTTQRAGTSAAKIYVRTSGIASLPAAGIRVGDAHLSFMPLFRQMSGGGSPPIKFANAAHDYVFVGIAVDAGVVTATSRLIEIGAPGLTNTADFPYNLTFERCHAYAYRGCNINAALIRMLSAGTNIIVRDSYIDNQEALIEGQGLGGTNFTGPVLFENNYIVASGENIMFGGAALDAGVVGADVTIRRNHLYKPDSWRTTYGGSEVVKNLFEIKAAKRVLVEDNVCENSWGPDQGHSCNLKSVNQTGAARDNVVECGDVTIRFNKWINVDGWMKITPGQNESGGTYVDAHSISVHDNLVVGLQNWSAYSAWEITNIADVRFANNTIMSDAPPSGSQGVPGTGNSKSGGEFFDNIWQRGGFGVKATGTAEGSASFNVGWNPDPDVRGNLLIAAASGSYPANNSFPATVAAVGFTNTATRDYTLSGGSAYLTAGKDGGAPGVDHTALATRIAGCITGGW